MTTKAPGLTGDRNIPSDLNDNYITNPILISNFWPD